MSSFKNLYIIIFKKINNKIGTKSLASKHIIDPRHNYKKARLLKDSCVKGTLIKIKPEPEKEHAVISKTKCVVHNVGKNGSKPKMVFRKKMQLDFVPFLDNPFMWLKGLYKNVYIDDDERIGTKYKVMPPLCSMPVVATNKNNFCAIHKSAKVLDSKSDTPVFDTEKSFSPSSADSPSVKNISVVTKDISCSTLDERSILATCLCVLPLEQNKIIVSKDIKEQQTNDKLKTTDSNDKAQDENLAVHDYYQTFKNYPSEINSLLASKSKDNEPVTVLRVNVEDIKSQLSDPESTKDQAMTKMFTFENNDKVNLTLLLDADELQNRKSFKNRETPKVVVSQTQQKPDCIEHIIRNYKVNLQSTLGDCDLSSLSNLGGKKNPPKKDEKKEKPSAINKNKSTPNTHAITKQPVVAKTITAVKKKPTTDTKIRTVQQSQPKPEVKPQTQTQHHHQPQQQQTFDTTTVPQEHWQMAPMQAEQMYYYYWPMPSQTYNEAAAWPNYEQQKTPLHMLNSNTNVQPQTPDKKTNTTTSQASNRTSQWQNYEQQNRPTTTTTPTTPTPAATPTTSHSSTPTTHTPDTQTINATGANKQSPDSKNIKQDTSTSKNNTAIKKDTSNANITAQPEEYAQTWPVSYMDAYNNAFAQQQNSAHSWYATPTQQQTFEQCAQQVYPQMMQQQPNQVAHEQHVQMMQETPKSIVAPPQPAALAKSETVPKKQKKKSTTEKITSTLIQFLNRTGSASNPETKKQTSAEASTVTNLQKQETVQQSLFTSGQATCAQPSTVATQETCAQPVILSASFVPLPSVPLSNPAQVEQPAYNARAWGETYGQACNNQQLQTFAQTEQHQLQFTQQQIEAANANSWQYYNQPSNEPNSQQIAQHTNAYMTDQSNQPERSQDKTESTLQNLEQLVFSQQISNQPVNSEENTENTHQSFEQLALSQSNQPVHSQEKTENTHQTLEQLALSQQISFQPVNTQENTQQQQQLYNKESVAQQHNTTWPENYTQAFYAATAHQEQPEKANNVIASQHETYMNTESHQPGDQSNTYSNAYAAAIHENWKKQYLQDKIPAFARKQMPVLNSTKVNKAEKTISASVEKKNSTKPGNTIVSKSTSNSENQPAAVNMTKPNSSITQQKNPWQPSDPFTSKSTTLKQDNTNKTSEDVLSVKQLEKSWPQNTQETYNVASSLKQDDLAKINNLLTEKQVTKNARKWQEKNNETASKKSIIMKSENAKNTPNFRGMYTANWQTFVKNPLESKINGTSVNKVKQEVSSAKKEIISEQTRSSSNWQKMFEANNKTDIPTKVETKTGSTLQELGTQQNVPEISAKSNKSSIQNQQVSSEWSQNAQDAYNTSSCAKWNEQQTQQNNATEVQKQEQQPQQFSAAWPVQNCYAPPAQHQHQHQQQQSAPPPQEYTSQYNASGQQYYYNPQTSPWQQQTSSHQYHTLNEAIAQQKLRTVQSEHELQQNYKLLDSYSMLDTKTDLYRVKDIKTKSPEYPKTNEVAYVPKYKSGLIDKVEKHYFCWKEHFFDKSNILQNSKNIDIVKQFEETLEQIKNIDNTVATVDNPEVFLTMPMNDFDIEDPNKEPKQNLDDKKAVISANQLSLPVSEVTDKIEPLKTVVREEEFKSDDMEMLSKIDTFVDVKPKLNSEKAMMKASDSFLLSKQLKDFPNIAKRKLHIQNVENVDLEEMCKHSSLLLNCRIVLDGSERNEPTTTLHAKVYDYKEKRDGFTLTPPRNKK